MAEIALENDKALETEVSDQGRTTPKYPSINWVINREKAETDSIHKEATATKIPVEDASYPMAIETDNRIDPLEEGVLDLENATETGDYVGFGDGYQSNLEVTAEQGEFHTADVIDLATPEVIADWGASDITFETADQGRTDDVIISEKSVSSKIALECDQCNAMEDGSLGSNIVLVEIPEMEQVLTSHQKEWANVLECDQCNATSHQKSGLMSKF